VRASKSWRGKRLVRKKRIVVFGTEPVTGKIGGLGIRQLETARTLSKHFEIRLVTPFEVGEHTEKFHIEYCLLHRPELVVEHVKWADAVFACQPTPDLARTIEREGRPLAIDIFPITYFEEIEHQPLDDKTPKQLTAHFSTLIHKIEKQLGAGDFFICASERERNYYLGVLTMVGKLRPHDYLDDKHFKKVIDIVPFGLPKRKPKTGKNLLRGKIDGIGMKDFLIVWGGALWNWYDCKTPIRAMARLRKSHPHIKLVFTATKHPATKKPPREYTKTLELAKKKGLLDKTVFFYTDWVPHAERDYYLSEADAGIATFTDHIENYFAYRIRLLDYIWAGLPVITNPGNTLSDMIMDKGLGAVFPFGDDKALAEKIIELATKRARTKKIRERVLEAKKNFYWDDMLKPLIRFLKNPRRLKPLVGDNRFKVSFYDLNRLKLKSILFLRSSPIHHSLEGIRAIQSLAPSAKIDVCVQRDCPEIESGGKLGYIKMEGNEFLPEKASSLLSQNGRYDTVVCAFANKDYEFYQNVIDFAGGIAAENYLAFNDDYQFTNIAHLCKD
jgi:hypothetical protein